jgi:predicted nuclease of predicted toxin-antitoxin system
MRKFIQFLQSEKFIVDENVGYSIGRFLNENGYDVKYVTELYPSRDDIFILERAYQEERILITNDKDFGHLIFKLNLNAIAIILFSV